MTYSNGFLIVGKELDVFINACNDVSKASYSTYLKRYGLNHKAQQNFEFKYHFDRQTRLGSVYLPLFSIFDHQLISYFKLDDKGDCSFFESTDSDLKLVFSSIKQRGIKTNKSSIIVSFNVLETIILNHCLDKLGILNVIAVYLPKFDDESLKVVHEQLPTDKVIFFNPNSTCFDDKVVINLNIISRTEANPKSAHKFLVKPLLQALKAF